MKSAAQLPVIGMDIAKNVFQLHLVDPETDRGSAASKVRMYGCNLPPGLHELKLWQTGGVHVRIFRCSSG
jgi:hypothetical protein